MLSYVLRDLAEHNILVGVGGWVACMYNHMVNFCKIVGIKDAADDFIKNL